MPWHPTVIDSEILSVHAAVVPVGPHGTVLMFGGDEHNPAQGGTDTTPANPANVNRTALFHVDRVARLALTQADDQLFTQFADRQGVKSVIDRLATDVGVFELGKLHGAQLAGNLFGRKALSQQMGCQLEQFAAGLELPAWAAGLATSQHEVLGLMGDVLAMGTTIAADLAADGGGAAVQHVST